MAKDLSDVMLNPTRMRIVQALAAHEKRTATELCELLNDVPRTTLYRHINILIDAKVLTIVEEKKIRGSLERTLSLNIDELRMPQDAKEVSKQAFGFLMNTYSKFQQYFDRDNFTPSNNKVFFNNTVMMMSDNEFDHFLADLQTLLVNYSFETSAGRKPRDISIISAPPAVDEHEG